MQFSKIGVTPTGTVEISYVRVTTQEERITLQCQEPPLASLDEALQALVVDVANICDQPLLTGKDPDGVVDDLSHTIMVRSVTIKHHDTLGRGVCITAIKTLSNGLNFTFTGPVLYEGGKMASLPKPTQLKIDTLEAEASKYIQGERLQGNLAL